MRGTSVIKELNLENLNLLKTVLNPFNDTISFSSSQANNQLKRVQISNTVKGILQDGFSSIIICFNLF